MFRSHNPISNDLIRHDRVVDQAQNATGFRVLLLCLGVAAPTTPALVDLVRKKAIRLIDDPNITKTGHSCHIAALWPISQSFINIGYCSSELSSTMRRFIRAMSRFHHSFVLRMSTMEIVAYRSYRRNAHSADNQVPNKQAFAFFLVLRFIFS